MTDIVIASAARTPVGSFNGAFSSVPAHYLGQVAIDGALQSMKADLRNFTYDGAVQLIAARLYQGQTTNFRTPGGGFAPVFVGDSSVAQTCC